MMAKKIVGAALGTCVHVSGLDHFLQLAASEGYQTIPAGPAISPSRLIDLIHEHKPDMVAISYRLMPETARSLFNELKRLICWESMSSLRFIFGGTPPVARIAEESGLFAKVFSGDEPIEEIRAFLRSAEIPQKEPYFASTLIERIQQTYPYPLLRHHFGLPSLAKTVSGAGKIADSQVLDVLSIGPDQNAQEHFFHPEEMDSIQDGAGGVPLRKSADLEALYAATRRGNYPLLRCYSGTRDLIPWAEMSVSTIRNAWGAIPLCWYNVLDGRSQRSIEDAIRENQSAMKWYAGQGLPVEVNESHQWSLRDAHDTLAVAMAFLAAYNAKKMGVHHYVAQYMFNTPPGTSPAMDIAKMLAKKALVETLKNKNFTIYTEVRAGIAHFSANPAMAKGQLAASTVISLVLKPHILHVVGYSEGDHAASADEVVESCRIVHGVLHDCLQGFPDLGKGELVRKRKRVLLQEAVVLLKAIRHLGLELSDDPWIDAQALTAAIRNGILDTPHFKGSAHARGRISTRCIEGAWYAVEAETGRIIPEEERTAEILASHI
jgi:hypothetical protein